MRTLLTLLAVGAFVAFVIWDLGAQGAVECNVCLQFNGITECSLGSGPNRTEAIQSGRTPICQKLARGVTEAFACTATQPISISCNVDE